MMGTVRPSWGIIKYICYMTFLNSKSFHQTLRHVSVKRFIVITGAAKVWWGPGAISDVLIGQVNYEHIVLCFAFISSEKFAFVCEIFLCGIFLCEIFFV